MGSSRFRSEITIILAALLVSFVIWLMAKMSTLDTEQINIPVFVDNLHENVRIEYSPKTIPIMVRFPQSQRSRVVPQNFEVRLSTDELFGDDPTQAWAGVDEPVVHTQNLTLDNVHALNLPQSIRVSELGPQSRIKIEAGKFTQVIPVKVQSSGTLPVNYELRAEITTDPAKVPVTAPPDVLKRFADPSAFLSTDPVKLDDRKADFIDYANLIVPPGLTLVDPNHKRVQVFVGVREKEVSRVIAGVPIEIFVFDDSLRARLTPSVAEVRVKGRISHLDQLLPSMFRFAPRTSLAETLGTTKAVELDAVLGEDVPLELRKGVVIESFTPQTVDIEFVKAPAAKD